MEQEPYPDPILEGARKYFGIPYLFPFQRLAIFNILHACGYFNQNGNGGDPGAGSVPDGSVDDLEPWFGDQIVLLPTGAGKSLCFQLPALLLPGITLVVYPLLSLMADQQRRLGRARAPVGVLQGGQTAEEREGLFRRLQEGEVKILLTNPETLNARPILEALSRLPITHLVIDEAHCIAQWGETFRPSYLTLGNVKATLSPTVTTAFTATASPTVIGSICQHLFGGESPHQIQANPDRPNIHYRVVATLSRERSLRVLLGNPKGRDNSPGSSVARPAIVFCRSRKRTELLALSLRRSLGEEDIYFYHAGLEKQEKKTIEQWFFHSQTGILVATTAYGMGVDKPNIRAVIHDEPPSTVEAYLQESGRGGRDGEPCQAILLAKEGSTNHCPPFFHAYVSTPECRRRFLYRELGAEVDTCAGCDTCDGNRVDIAEGENVFMQFLRKNPRRYTVEEMVDILRGATTPRTATEGLRRSRWFGQLEGWRKEEAREGLDDLFHRGLVKRGKLLWKNRLFLGSSNPLSKWF